MITKDGKALRDRLVSDQPSAVTYDAPKPELAAEDKLIGSSRLGIRPEAVRIVPLEEVFAR
jgi:zinc protease